LNTFTLWIKNMVCDRCIRVVREEMETLGYEVLNVQLGKCVIAADDIPDPDKIRAVLHANGFELLEDESSQWIEQIKTAIISLIYRDELEERDENLSHYLTVKLRKDYPSLSRLFSSVEGLTIEKYFILQKIERVKELLIYDQLSLKEISYRLDYSSVQHLSNQFKKIIGQSPREFKQQRTPHRHTLDHIQKVNDAK